MTQPVSHFDELVAEHLGLARRFPAWIERLERVYPYADVSMTLARVLEIGRTGPESFWAEGEPRTGVIVRAYDGTGFCEFASADLSPARLEAMVDRAVAHARLRPGGAPMTPLEPLQQDFRVREDVPVGRVPMGEKIALVEDLFARLLGRDRAVVLARAEYGEDERVQVFASRGRTLTQRIPKVQVFFQVYVSDGRSTHYATWGGRRPGGFEVAAAMASDLHIDETLARAKARLRAEPVPAGLQTIVAGPTVAAVIAHEAFGHGVEADTIAQGCARASLYMGKRVASDLVTMVDDPGDGLTTGFYFFDDEGVLAQRTVILDRGILVAGLCDRLAAARLGWAPTGNGRRVGLRHRIFSRMSNTFILPGETAPEDMIRAVDRGVFLQGEAGGQEDPLCWGLQVNVHTGEEIRDGRLTGKAFASPMLTGSVPDLLRSVRAVGDDSGLWLGRGNCGKTFRKDWIDVAGGSPSLLMEGRLS